MNFQEENENIKGIEINLLHSDEADSVEAMMDLAVVGLVSGVVVIALEEVRRRRNGR